jgi:2-methylisocitrate lyase-like PEP mutase family enzyme
VSVSTETRLGHARLLRALHQGERILVLPNAWDVISARVFEDCGFEAVGTTSFGIARAHGLKDGQNAARECSLETVRRISAALAVPLTADIEAGYGESAKAVEQTGRAFIEAGAVGFNIEDGQKDAVGPLVDPSRHCERIAALREAGDVTGVPVFINARTDVFWLRVGRPQTRLESALRRAEAYLAAGADGIFIPGVSDAATIRDAVGAIGAPLNVLAGPHTPPVHVLQELGVRRLSLGSGPMRAALGLLRTIAAELKGAGTYRYLDDAPSYDAANAL